MTKENKSYLRIGDLYLNITASGSLEVGFWNLPEKEILDKNQAKELKSFMLKNTINKKIK